MFMVTACTSTKFVEVPVVNTEYIHDTVFDSIYVKDSVDRYIRGDTVFIYKERVKYKYLNKTDTVLKTDSIPVVVNKEVVKKVEVNHMKWYQETFMWIGVLSSLILFGLIIYKTRI